MGARGHGPARGVSCSGPPPALTWRSMPERLPGRHVTIALGARDVLVISPFRGVRYDPDRISFISRVVAPPYDVMDPELEQELLARDRHNVVRLTFGRTPPEGRSDEDYVRAAQTFAEWRREGILMQDPEPSIYVVEQSFRVGRRELVQWGFIAAVLLEELGTGSIFPHERTMKAPRSDRFRLIAACRANLSHILGVYSDPDGAIDRFVRELCSGLPAYCFRDAADVGHLVWVVHDRPALARLSEHMRKQFLVIADGHHRYESAYEYSRECRAPGEPAGAAATDYVPVFCVSLANAGLTTLPTHRRAKSPMPMREEAFLEALSANFDLETLRVRGAAGMQEDFDRARAGDACIGCYLRGQRLVLLRPRDLRALRGRFPESANSWWELPVSLLHYVVLPDALGIRPGTEEESTLVDYRHDANEIHWSVEAGRYDVGFLLPPTCPQVLERVATERQRLPLKSTYFYPKLPSGLVFHVHDDEAASGPAATNAS